MQQQDGSGELSGNKSLRGRVDMPRRPASLTQADIARAIRAAKQAGAKEIEVRVGTSLMVFRIVPSTGQETPLEASEEIVL